MSHQYFRKSMSHRHLRELYLQNIRLNELMKYAKRTNNQNAGDDLQEIEVQSHLNDTNEEKQSEDNKEIINDLQELNLENIRLKEQIYNMTAAYCQNDDDQFQDKELQSESDALGEKKYPKRRKEVAIDRYLQELSLENITLKEKIHNMLSANGQKDVNQFHDIELQSRLDASSKKKDSKIRKQCCRMNKLCTWKPVVIVLMFIVLFSSNVYLLHKAITSSDAMTENMLKQQRLMSNPIAPKLTESMLRGNENTGSIHNINVGMRNDYRLQDCQGSNFKQTFPDVDYAFLGYNVLKGYPLAVGHDPGFTYPIFTADYSGGSQTADCRYSVPQGLIIVPDVSCVTSFSSKTVQTKYEFSKSLSVSASVGGGGWGVSFSASAGYKQSSSDIATGESVFILSTAKCVYYFSKLVIDNAPRFSDTFLKWILRLNSAETKDVYLDFFDTYGTHFLSYVTFGSRFTYEHKMSSSKYQSERSKGVNVAVQASYSGLFSAGAGFSLDASQKLSASTFSKNVETRTITIGAPPPANGDAMTWASTVKESPVPMEYKLVSIEKLFTEKYMGNLNVNHTKIALNIERFKFEYCKYLKEDGQLDSCESLTPGIVLTNTKLSGDYKSKALSFAECIDFCLQDIECEAITVCKTCTEDEQVCYMYAEKHHEKSADLPNTGNGWPNSNNGDEWESIVFVTKIASYMKFIDTNVIGNERGSKTTENCLNSTELCQSFCVKDVHCVAFTYSDCNGKLKNCHLYSKNRIKGMKKESGVKAYFIFNRELTNNNPTTTAAFNATTQE